MEQISQRDDEIDLFELFESIWDGKWKIILISLLTGLLGVAYVVLAPTSLSGSLGIEEGRAEIFDQYVSLNQQLRESQAGMLEKYNFGNQQLRDSQMPLLFDGEDIFKEFVTEFRDYDEVVAAVQQYSSKYLEFEGSQAEKNELLFKLAKQFEVIPPSKNDTDWYLRFEWYDEAEAKLILKQVLTTTVENVKVSMVTRAEQYANALNIRRNLAMEKARLELEAIGSRLDLETQMYLQRLSEQAQIARALGMELSQIGKSGQGSGVEVSVQSTEMPLYLRGYRALEKELSLIKSREKELNYLEDEAYLEVKQHLFDLESDVTADQILRSVKQLAQDSAKNWVNYRMDLLEVKSQKKSLIALVSSIMVGGMIGIFYVLISTAYRNRKQRA